MVDGGTPEGMILKPILYRDNDAPAAAGLVCAILKNKIKNLT